MKLRCSHYDAEWRGRRMMVSADLPIEAFASDTTLACEAIGIALREGSLFLVLGAGTSLGMGLPNWWELVRDCGSAAGVVFEDPIDAETDVGILTRAMSRVERTVGDNNRYKDIVRNGLYGKCRADRELLHHDLLGVLGAMTMQSRRGAASEVLTFNFDDVLERYLGLHGFWTQPIVRLPTLRRDVDVTIYHPHGFLASPDGGGEDSDEIILSEYSFDNRLGDRLNGWQELLRDALHRKIALFIGLSYDQPTLKPTLTFNDTILAENRGPTGYWLRGPGDAVAEDNELVERNLVPVRLDDYADFPEFLLKVCQHAGAH